MFLKDKALKLLILALLCEVIGRLLKLLVLRDDFRIDISLFTSWNWYIYEMTVYYIAFYFVYKYIRGRNAKVVCIGIFSLVVSVFTWYMSNSVGGFWTHAFRFSSLCFWVGILLHEYNNLLIKLVGNKIVSSIILIICGLASCICLGMPQGSFWG